MENFKDKELPHLDNITPECLPQIDADLAKLQNTLEAAEDAKKWDQGIPRVSRFGVSLRSHKPNHKNMHECGACFGAWAHQTLGKPHTYKKSIGNTYDKTFYFKDGAVEVARLLKIDDINTKAYKHDPDLTQARAMDRMSQILHPLGAQEESFSGYQWDVPPHVVIQRLRDNLKQRFAPKAPENKKEQVHQTVHNHNTAQQSKNS